MPRTRLAGSSIITAPLAPATEQALLVYDRVVEVIAIDPFVTLPSPA
jgi:hypothetical protein